MHSLPVRAASACGVMQVQALPDAASPRRCGTLVVQAHSSSERLHERIHVAELVSQVTLQQIRSSVCNDWQQLLKQGVAGVWQALL